MKEGPEQACYCGVGDESDTMRKVCVQMSKVKRKDLFMLSGQDFAKVDSLLSASVSHFSPSHNSVQASI